MPAPPTEASRNLSQAEIPYEKMDFRHFRNRSNRTVLFACKITPNLDQTIRRLSLQENRMIVEIFEEALDFYLKNKGINMNTETNNKKSKQLEKLISERDKTDGEKKTKDANATNHFTPSSGQLDNLYKIKVNNSEVETTEEQIISTIAYIVQALKNVDAADFTAKYNAKQSDSSKQTKVKDYLTRLQQQEIIVGSDKDKFFEFIELVHQQPFLKDLDADKQKQQLKDYGINIDPAKTTLYKTDSEKQTLAVGTGIGDNGMVTDGTYTLPESLDSIQVVKDQLEMEKLGAAVKLIELKKTIEDKTQERNTKQGEITAKETAIDALIKEIIAKKRETLASYNLKIRYLENDGDATANSSVTEENTALTEIESIRNKLLVGNLDYFLVDTFLFLALAGDSKLDIQQAISRVKAGKYTEDDKEHDTSIYGGLAR
ncbi:2229_t:CDS:2, partial [Racocetra persica]